MHSIVGVDQRYEPDDAVTALDLMCNVGGNTAETSGVEYQKLSVLTGGIRYPSCDLDYASVFDSIAATLLPLACRLDLTQTSLAAADRSRINVEIDYGSGSQTILQDTTLPCDGGANGWQYAKDDTAIELCGAACSDLTASAAPVITVTTGCATETR